ncbi:MAG: hypothetical protein R3218_03695 [Christiangramia sp.]|nr:hypothetical protein [Christiangramia sp.]
MSLKFKKKKQLDLCIAYPDVSDDFYLNKLRVDHKLDSLIDPEASELQNILNVQLWVHSRWEPDNTNRPKKNYPSYILKQAKKGEKFRPEDYGTVSIACLQALGFTVRGLWLFPGKINDMENVKAHIVHEVYLKDRKKWLFIDPSYNILIKKDGVHLNAVELQQALIKEKEIEVLNPLEKISTEEYLEWIGPYLYCFTTSLNKGSIKLWDRVIGRKKKLTLVPVGERPPRKLSKIIRKRTNIVTNSLGDFYTCLDN